MCAMAAANRLLNGTLVRLSRSFRLPDLATNGDTSKWFLSRIVGGGSGWGEVAWTAEELSKSVLLSVLREVVPRMVGLTAEARLACVRSGGKGQASVADRWLKRAFD